MPIYLPAPEAPANGPDGKGWNRLSLNAHGGFLNQCALRPRRWGALLDSRDTRRASWGGFGRCINHGGCGDCPLRKARYEQCTVVPVNAPRVLVRIEPLFADDAMFGGVDGFRLWVTTGPADREYRNGQPWTWEDAVRVRGWNLGSAYVDDLGEGFWLERTAFVPAVGCAITTRARSSFTRHAFRVKQCRVALLHCSGGCAHDVELLNAVSHACPGPDGADELRVPVRWAQAQQMALAPNSSIGFRFDVRPMYVEIVASDRDRTWVRLTLTGSGWTVDRVRAAGEALRDHLTGH
ncbi:hypothetical protein ABZ682_22890 [Streptomyces griseoviridis]|uniref:hypothetical protein n=1 Tax=Streptomyces griseoviridis TaxID=45398 RepID=UPI0033E4470E